MELIVKEIIHLVRDCEANKPVREAEKIRVERKCYEDIKAVVEPFMNRNLETGGLYEKR